MRQQKYRCRQNIGADKIYASTKYMRQQNICVNKMWAGTKSWHWQNLASTKRWRRRRRISLLLDSEESVAADFSQAPIKISYFSLMVMLSVNSVVKWGIVSSCPAFMGRLSPYYSDLLYWPAMLKMSKTLANYRCAPKIHWFSLNCSSPYICSQASYQKGVKTKSDHHHCPISVCIL